MNAITRDQLAVEALLLRVVDVLYPTWVRAVSNPKAKDSQVYFSLNEIKGCKFTVTYFPYSMRLAIWVVSWGQEVPKGCCPLALQVLLSEAFGRKYPCRHADLPVPWIPTGARFSGDEVIYWEDVSVERLYNVVFGDAG